MIALPAPALFRHIYTSTVATLSRQWGVHRVAWVEDAVQSALMTAVERWPHEGLPGNPAAWVCRVAQNRLRDDARRQNRRLDAPPVEVEAVPSPDGDAAFRGEADDALLRMLFVCCEPSVPVESQVVFALKVLCGFSVAEIASRLFVSEDNVYKRLQRARAALRSRPHALDVGPERYASRLDAVLLVIYLLFTEGHLASHGAEPVRADLCAEALRLGGLLAHHPVGGRPKVAALMALMHLHAARIEARRDGVGELVLLEEQDRSRWDQTHLYEGFRWLSLSAEGEVVSRYHAEAGIAAAHGLAPSFAETDWARVADGYALLERVAPSPWHRLNRALAVAELRGPRAGIELLAELEPGARVASTSAWAAGLCDLHRRAGRLSEAAAFRAQALERAPTEAVRRVLERRLRIEGRQSG